MRRWAARCWQFSSDSGCDVGSPAGSADCSPDERTPTATPQRSRAAPTTASAATRADSPNNNDSAPTSARRQRSRSRSSNKTLLQLSLRCCDVPPRATAAESAQPAAMTAPRALPLCATAAAKIAQPVPCPMSVHSQRAAAKGGAQPVHCGQERTARRSAQPAARALLPGPPPPRIRMSGSGECAVIRWASAVEDAQLLMSQAAAAYPRNIIITKPVMNVSSATVEARVRDLAGRARKGGYNMYIGSTTSPQWRWEGGSYYPSAGYYDEPAMQKKYMRGHSLIWERMHVLGSWPDSEAAAMEEVAINIGKRSGALVDNIANDSRGLPRRGPYNYAFVYVVCDFD